MGDGTKIEWATASFNPWRGCHKVSPGCARCYAEHSPHARISRARGDETWGKDALRTPASEAMWSEPFTWDRRADKSGVRGRVFCASLADVFEDRPDLDPHRARLFDTIRKTPHLDWLLLTKRPGNFCGLLRRAALIWKASAVPVGFVEDLRITAFRMLCWFKADAQDYECTCTMYGEEPDECMLCRACRVLGVQNPWDKKEGRISW